MVGIVRRKPRPGLWARGRLRLRSRLAWPGVRTKPCLAPAGAARTRPGLWFGVWPAWAVWPGSLRRPRTDGVWPGIRARVARPGRAGDGHARDGMQVTATAASPATTSPGDSA